MGHTTQLYRFIEVPIAQTVTTQVPDELTRKHIEDFLASHQPRGRIASIVQLMHSLFL